MSNFDSVALTGFELEGSKGCHEEDEKSKRGWEGPELDKVKVGDAKARARGRSLGLPVDPEGAALNNYKTMRSESLSRHRPKGFHPPRVSQKVHFDQSPS